MVAAECLDNLVWEYEYGNSCDRADEENLADRSSGKDPLAIYFDDAKRFERLSRHEEELGVKKIERNRNRYYRTAMASELVIGKVIRVLNEIFVGKRNLSRSFTLQSSNHSGLDSARRAAERHMLTLVEIRQRNRFDFHRILNPATPKNEKNLLRRQILARRRHAGRLIAELPLRDELFLTPVSSLERIAAAMCSLRQHIKQNPNGNNDRQKRRLRFYQETFLETPKTIRRFIKRLKTAKRRYDDAKNHFSSANLRLVVSIAKNYQYRGISLLDLVQEGNYGLLRAVDRFEQKRNLRFSTYATYWIRQAILKAIADYGRTIRLPAHLLETLARINRTAMFYRIETGNDPTLDDTSENCHIPLRDLSRIVQYGANPVSLDVPIDSETGQSYADLVVDTHTIAPEENVSGETLRDKIFEALQCLTEQEQEVIQDRFGLRDGRSQTLDEVGRKYSLSRERIRQIETTAVRKLRRPLRSPAQWAFANVDE